MERAALQSFGFHLAALALLGLGVVLAANLTNRVSAPDMVIVNVDGRMTESRVVARGAACQTSSTDDELPIRGYLAK